MQDRSTWEPPQNLHPEALQDFEWQRYVYSLSTSIVGIAIVSYRTSSGSGKCSRNKYSGKAWTTTP